MRHLLLATLLLLAWVRVVQAQVDTSFMRLRSLRPAPALTATGLMATGGVLAFNPTAHSLAVSLRDEVVASRLPRLHFDDYVQYLPAATPIVLNLCGMHGQHSLSKLTMLEGTSYLIGGGWLNAFKYGFVVRRPDESSNNSFPSGHSFMAFAGAELLRREYGKDYPWIAVAGYTVATVVALMRIYNNRHWAGDVLAGAGLGIMSVTIAYWLLD